MPLPDSVFLTCPKCVDEGRGGLARMGNQRTKCALCNRFQQAVFRRVARTLIDKHAKEAADLKVFWEHSLHPNLVDAYRYQTAAPDPDDIVFDDVGQVIQ